MCNMWLILTKKVENIGKYNKMIKALLLKHSFFIKWYYFVRNADEYLLFIFHLLRFKSLVNSQ